VSDLVRVHPGTNTPRGRSPEAVINTLTAVLPNRVIGVTGVSRGELGRLDSQFMTVVKCFELQ
jgi:hypothetical protein